LNQRPAPGASPWRLLQLTDTHVTAAAEVDFDGLDTLASLRRVLRHVADVEGSAQAMVLSGDLVHEASPAAYGRLRMVLEEIDLPVYCLPGNHDDAEMMRSHLQGGNISCPRRLEPPGWQVLLLDSRIPGAPGGHLPLTELQWLERQLRQHAERHVLVCLHHQPVPIGSAWMDAMGLDNGEEFLRLLDAWPRVRAVVWGHVHQEFHARRGTMDLYGTPSTCIQFRPASPVYARDTRGPGYRRLDLYADGVLESQVLSLPAEPA